MVSCTLSLSIKSDILADAGHWQQICTLWCLSMWAINSSPLVSSKASPSRGFMLRITDPSSPEWLKNNLEPEPCTVWKCLPPALNRQPKHMWLPSRPMWPLAMKGWRSMWRLAAQHAFQACHDAMITTQIDLCQSFGVGMRRFALLAAFALLCPSFQCRVESPNGDFQVDGT